MSDDLQGTLAWLDQHPGAVVLTSPDMVEGASLGGLPVMRSDLLMKGSVYLMDRDALFPKAVMPAPVEPPKITPFFGIHPSFCYPLVCDDHDIWPYRRHAIKRRVLKHPQRHRRFIRGPQLR